VEPEELRPQTAEVGPRVSSERARTASDHRLIKQTCFYCTGRRRIPGLLTVSQACVQFEPDPRVQEVQDRGIGAFQAFIEMVDIIECGAVTVPAEEVGDDEHQDVSFLQLHLRPRRAPEASGGRPRSNSLPSPPRSALRAVVFKMSSREILYEVASLVIEFIDHFRDGPPPARTLTSVPFCVSVDRIDSVMTQSPRSSQQDDIVRVESAERVGNGRFSIRRLPNGGRVEELSLGDFTRTQICYPADHSDTLCMCLELAQELSFSLPLSLRFQQLECVYAPRLHGISLQTFYRQFEQKPGPSVMLVIDTEGHVFGAFASESWRGAGKFYGTGESFVFSFGYVDLVPKAGVGLRPRAQELTCQAFPWTSRNSFLMFSDDSVLAMGGGGKNALTIDGDFLRGTSNPCSTFESPTLSSSEEFVIRAIEFWGFKEADD